MSFARKALFAGLFAGALAVGGCGGGGDGRAVGDTPQAASTSDFHPIAGGFKPNDVTLESCTDAATRARCLEQGYGNLAFEQGSKVALARVADDMAASTEIERGCHRIVHMVGSAALARAKGDVGQAFTAGDSTCWSGYYHGILERALVGATDDTLLAGAVRRICDGVLRDETRFIAYQCVHGIGHGLMIQTGLHLTRSLDLCDRLKTPWEQTSCHGGVYMENFNTSYGVKSKFLKDDDLLYPCDAVNEKRKYYCYLQVTDRILAATGYDWVRAAELCSGAEQAWRAICFQSFGRNASGVARLDRQELLRLCNVPTRPWRSDCVYGAVRDITSNDAGAPRALLFCTAVASNLRGRCYNGLGTILHEIVGGAAGLAQACEAVPASFRPQCRLEQAS